MNAKSAEADLLDRAMELLDQHGWVQEEYESEDGSLCVSGAIAKALSGKATAGAVKLKSPGSTEAVPTLSTGDLVLFNQVMALVVTAANSIAPRSVVDGVECDCDADSCSMGVWESVPEWNDHPNVTFQSVEIVFKEAVRLSSTSDYREFASPCSASSLPGVVEGPGGE